MYEYDPREALEEIDNDLTVLENVLKPLLEAGKPWTDVLDTLSNMEQAKMGMIMAYGVCDLIWSEFAFWSWSCLVRWRGVLNGRNDEYARWMDEGEMQQGKKTFVN
ncbi:hypothetical protein QFC22_005255 [Naganishia vaughanmartiniae]|uniref:Uncharacterized protein n=1 Tax=Naganishia vaughanmartiniae TaxID=1424756 RepID=A0ACC2WWT8_9TREE|nr:hypothetical protein QFC22_005255 [Naganishia vaughanmartiniae]